MNEFKGTPGPWQHLGDPEDGECRVRQTASVKRGQGFYSEITICENITSRKNANMIAAAPDLFEALRACLPFADAEGLVNGVSIKAALLKALGEKP